MDLTFFNPRAQKEADFLAAFCARQNTLEFFLRQLRRLAGSQAPAQHHLIVAPRGYGKTSLLRRIAIAIRQDDSLRAHWLPLSFREEQHNVISLDVLWQNCLQSLQEALDSEGADDATLDALDDVIDQHAPRSQLKREAQDGRPAEAYLMDYCRRHGRRPLLLIDNLDALLAGLSTEHQWAWRASLQAANGPVLLAAAARYPDALRDHDAAFYDFFRLHPLERLSDAEVMQCLSHIARQRGDKGVAVLNQLQRQPGKIATLNTLAGGNPRTLSVLYSVLEAHMNEDVLDNLSAMLDQFTGWYQARTEELPMQARAVFDAVALHWDPITAAQLASVTGLEVTVINSQLSRLDKQGYIEAVKLSHNGKGRNAYQVSERFYNIWYLMRHGSRRLERRIRFLTAFLQSLYTPDECQQLSERLLQRPRVEPATALALAHNLPASETRQRLLNAVEAQLDDDASLAQEYHKVRRILAEQDQAASSSSRALPWPESVATLIEQERYTQAEVVLRQALAHTPDDASLWFHLGRLLHKHLGRYEEAEATYRQAIELDAKDATPWNGLGNLLHYRLARYDEAETAYRQAIELDAKYANPWNDLGNLLYYRLARYEEAEAAYLQAIKLDAKYANPWNDLGNLLQYRLARYDEAEAAYLQAIKLDAKYANPWNGLGNLLQYRLARYDEAEMAYRQAIELDAKDAYPWNGLGHLLQRRLARYDEAETAYRQAIKLDAKYANPWNGLGNLLQHRLARYDEAETAYRQAIELDAKYAYPWNNLGNLLHYRLARYDEAEAAYRQAIELDAKYATPWNGLGNLLHYRLARYDEAEAAYRQAIGLDSKDATPWAGLGDLLQDHLVRYDEAEAAYRQAIQLDAKDATPWTNLGNLLQDHLARYDEAEAAYRRAIELDSALSDLWNRLGNLRQDGLGWLDAAQEAYLAGLALEPDNGFLNTNLAYLLSLRLQQPRAAQPYLEKAMKSAEVSAAGQRLLHALAQASAGPASVWSAVQQALASEDPELFGSYQDDLQRLLVWLVEQGHGAEMRVQMLADKYDERYAPLHHAVIALLDREDHLLTINPETRSAAQRLYAGMAQMRRCWRAPLAG